MDFFKFDQLITPKILSIIYLLLVIFCIVMAVKTGGTNGIQMICWIIAALFVVALEVNYIYDKRHGREGFLRFNVDYKRLMCFRPPFNIIYIMRINIVEAQC